MDAPTSALRSTRGQVPALRMCLTGPRVAPDNNATERARTSEPDPEPLSAAGFANRLTHPRHRRT